MLITSLIIQDINTKVNRILPKHILDKIVTTAISINKTQDKIIWRFTLKKKSLKTAIWANND